jgi:hypothetical protein
VQHEPQVPPAPPTSPATTPSNTPTATIPTASDGSTLALATAPPLHASTTTHKQPRQQRHPHHSSGRGHTSAATACCGGPLLRWCWQLAVLLSRFMALNRRNVPLYWVRLVTFLLQCACCGTLFWRLGDSWADVQARAGLLFFVVASLSFMAIATAPAAMDDLKVGCGLGRHHCQLSCGTQVEPNMQYVTQYTVSVLPMNQPGMHRSGVLPRHSLLT